MIFPIYQVLHVASMVLMIGFLFQAFANPDPKNKKKSGILIGSLALLRMAQSKRRCRARKSEGA